MNKLTAKEAHDLTYSADSVMDEIKKVAKSGKTYVVWGDMTSDLKEELTKLGYTVWLTASGYRISWYIPNEPYEVEEDRGL